MTTNLLSISFIRLAVPGKKLILTRQATGQNFTKMSAFYVDKQHSPGVPNPSRKTEAELPNLVTTITCHSVRTSCIFTCHCVCPFLITSGWVTITNAVPGGDQSALCLDAFRYKIVVGSSSLPQQCVAGPIAAGRRCRSLCQVSLEISPKFFVLASCSFGQLYSFLVTLWERHSRFICFSPLSPRSLSSILSGRTTSTWARQAKEVEDLWCFENLKAGSIFAITFQRDSYEQGV